MKNLFFVLFFCLAIKTSAQNISGIYSGTIKNDSLKMTQNYELALSEYKGKITGYSYITFVKNDTFYYGIKRIKASRENGNLVVEDVEMLMNNYPQKPDKGVHLINTFPLVSDSVVDLNGTWRTTESKKHRFYSIGGNMSLRRDDDSSRSALINHLKELQVIKYQPDQKAIAKKEKQKKEEPSVAQKETKPTDTTRNMVVNKKDPDLVAEKGRQKQANTKPAKDVVSIKEEQPTTFYNEQTPNQATQTNTLSSSVKTDAVVTTKNSSSNPNQTADKQKEAAKQTTVKPSQSSQSSSEKTTNVELNNSVAGRQVSAQAKVSKESENVATITAPETKANLAPSVLEKRASNTMQTVTVSSDSLLLSFYDNGIVDGDSISVYLNNENIITKVKLTEAAAKKTIRIPQTTDEVKITLVAESLGSIPPNTGLLIIQDGNDRYNVRFSADMETNASVIIKKKRN